MGMEVTIKDPVAKYRDTYVAEVMFMEGDADGDTLWEIELKSLVEVWEIYTFDKAWRELHRRDQWDLRNRSDDKKLAGLPGFGFLFSGDIDRWPIEEATIDLLEKPRLQDYRWYKLYWYDSTGLQHNVEVTDGH